MSNDDPELAASSVNMVERAKSGQRRGIFGCVKYSTFSEAIGAANIAQRLLEASAEPYLFDDESEASCMPAIARHVVLSTTDRAQCDPAIPYPKLAFLAVEPAVTTVASEVVPLEISVVVRDTVSGVRESICRMLCVDLVPPLLRGDLQSSLDKMNEDIANTVSGGVSTFALQVVTNLLRQPPNIATNREVYLEVLDMLGYHSIVDLAKGGDLQKAGRDRPIPTFVLDDSSLWSTTGSLMYLHEQLLMEIRTQHGESARVSIPFRSHLFRFKSLVKVGMIPAGSCYSNRIAIVSLS